MLHWAEYWYNTSYQSSTRMTPFKALYRRDPPTVACYIWGSSPSDLIETYLLDRDAIVDLLKANLVQVQT